MEIHHGLPAEALGPSLVSLGSFDGVHLGHQRVVSRLVETARAEASRAVLITFEPHPRCVLDPVSCPKSITTLSEKVALFAPLGVDALVVMRFDHQLASLGAQDFVDLLRRSLDLRGFVQGPDFTFGRGREGDLTWLREHGQRVVEVPCLEVDRQEVHSSEIRRLLTLGDVEGAGRLLGRHFALTGPVEPGDRIGRELGFPTANVAVEPNKLVPGHGVYAGWVRSPAGEHAAALSVGYRPTFQGTQLRVEAYLLDFSGDLYHQQLEIRFVARLRDEVRYETREALISQMGIDVEDTRRILDGHR